MPANDEEFAHPADTTTVQPQAFHLVVSSPKTLHPELMYIDDIPTPPYGLTDALVSLFDVPSAEEGGPGIDSPELQASTQKIVVEKVQLRQSVALGCTCK